jgi:hypothetical protein
MLNILKIKRVMRSCFIIDIKLPCNFTLFSNLKIEYIIIYNMNIMMNNNSIILKLLMKVGEMPIFWNIYIFFV